TSIASLEILQRSLEEAKAGPVGTRSVLRRPERRGARVLHRNRQERISHPPNVRQYRSHVRPAEPPAESEHRQVLAAAYYPTGSAASRHGNSRYLYGNRRLGAGL